LGWVLLVVIILDGDRQDLTVAAINIAAEKKHLEV
jgi:hypothetical protein